MLGIVRKVNVLEMSFIRECKVILSYTDPSAVELEPSIALIKTLPSRTFNPSLRAKFSVTKFGVAQVSSKTRASIVLPLAFRTRTTALVINS